jgi:hypothetical protein
MTDVTIPKFKGWTKPETVVEALERSLEHAKIEQKWVSGSWFDTGDLDLPFVNDWHEHWDEGEGEYVDGPNPAEKEQVDKAFSQLVCTNVTACSAGIVAIETLDGEALYSFLRNGEELDINLLRDDPIAWGALTFVARGFFDEFGLSSGWTKEMVEKTPIDFIIHNNDTVQPLRDADGNDLGYGDDKHHTRIVRGFEKALELAKAA